MLWVEDMTYVLGVHMTAFGRYPDRSHKDLVASAVRGTIEDSGLAGEQVQSMWFANCDLHQWGQPNIRGHVCLGPLFQTAELKARTPITNVEGGCASGFVAFRGACLDVMSGQADIALAVGVDKPYQPKEPQKMRALYDGIFDQLDFELWRKYYDQEAQKVGARFEPSAHRLMLLDVCDLHTRAHVHAHGTQKDDLAFVAAKNRAHGALNTHALLQEAMSAEAIAADRAVVGDLTRSMCAPVADGAAACIVISEGFYRDLSAKQKARAVRVEGLAFRSGTLRSIDAPSITADAAAQLYGRTELRPSSIDFAEVHDATSLEEIAAIEALGFADAGRGVRHSREGHSAREGRQPINVSGGLVSKGHPPAASGLAMVHDVTTQLRGEAQQAQLPSVRRGLVHNAGGLVGLDEANCGLAVLSAS